MEDTLKRRSIKKRKQKPKKIDGVRVYDLDDILQKKRGIVFFLSRIILPGIIAILAIGFAFRANIENVTGTPPFFHTYTYTVFSNISDGEVVLNGKVVSHRLPATISIHTWFRQPIDFTITLKPAMMSPIACHFVENVDSNSKCSMLIYHGDTRNVSHIAIFFPTSDTDLTLQDRQKAFDAVNTYLLQYNLSTDVPVGSQYGILNDKQTLEMHTSKEPMVVYFAPMLFSTIPSPNCVSLCAPMSEIITPFQPGSDTQWEVSINTQFFWEFFRKSDNQKIGVRPEISGVYSFNNYNLKLRWNKGAWSVDSIDSAIHSLALPQVIQNDAQTFSNTMQSALNTSSNTASGPKSFYNPFASDCRGADGCLLEIQVSDYDWNGMFTDNHFNFYLWRFGNLYSANQYARSANPNLPRANATDLLYFQNSYLWNN